MKMFTTLNLEAFRENFETEFYFRLVATACLNFRRDFASKIKFACRLRNDLLGTSASSSEPAPTFKVWNVLKL